MAGMVGLLDLADADELLEKICLRYGVEPSMLRHLLEVEQGFVGMARRRGLFDMMDEALGSSPEAAA